MKLFLKDIFYCLKGNVLRTLFALLGMIMGVASVVLIVSAIEGSTLLARKIIKKLGPDAVFIVSGSIGQGPRHSEMTLTMKDVKMISKIDGIFALTYGIVRGGKVSSVKYSKKTAIFGVGPNWIKSWDYKMQLGRDFSTVDYKKLRKVCIVGWDVADYFFPHQDPVGKVIIVKKTPFKIIGVYERRGKTPNGLNIDDRVFIPIGIYRKVVYPEYKYVTLIRFRVKDMSRYGEIVKEVKHILLMNHKKEDFTVITPALVKKFLSMMSASLSMFLGIASLTALVVGGFVLSSIFYINVYVRRWEIGLRRALGATRREIIIRIMAESLAISVIGAVLGSVLGLAGVKFLLPRLSIPVVYPAKAFLIAALLSMATAAVASYAPAKKAAEFEPVESLRTKV